MGEGRRPDGPGWYWYEGDGEGVELADPVYCAVTLAITLKPGTPWYRPWTIPIEEMPGDFVPLTKPVAAPSTELRESLAAVSHEIWAHWMRHQFSVSKLLADGAVKIPAQLVGRWSVQMTTPYADLTEQEKESDRHQADKILAVFSPPPVAAPEPDWSQEPPTVEGDWWLWNSAEPATLPFALPLVCTNGVWRFLANDGQYILLRDMPTTVWYKPGRIPQPPTEEVGP